MPRRPAQPQLPDEEPVIALTVVPVRRARKVVSTTPEQASLQIESAVATASVPNPTGVPRTAQAPTATRPTIALRPTSALTAAPPSAPAAANEVPPPRTARIAPVGALPPARIPPEALASVRNNRLLSWTFGVSLALHLIVLSIHFAPAVVKDFGRAPLEVALVNAKTKEKPAKADVLAQANLDGGGNTDKDRRARSPLPVLPKESAQNEVALTTQKVEDLERQAKEMLTAMRAKASIPVAPKAPDAPDPSPELPTANEMMQRTLEAMRLEAQIAKDMDAYQKRPKRKFLGARAEEYRFARYVEDWRLKVERVGNLNYPEAARAKKLYGSLILTVSIRADGSIEHVEVSKSSGKRILDAAAVKIVEMAAPYASFPPDIRRDTDIVHITRTWSFTKGDELVSQ
ncbi:MAG TPA: TonB family protein [Casimicrobiaceae bacterium]|nr:TonB family protein [Casimicrobiaceae bacterium]